MRKRLEQLLAKGRDNALLRFGLGHACLQKGDAVAAIEHLRRATQHSARYPGAWKLLGKAHRDLGDWDGARMAWESGIEAAQAHGDAQAAREMTVFLRRLPRGRLS